MFSKKNCVVFEPKVKWFPASTQKTRLTLVFLFSLVIKLMAKISLSSWKKKSSKDTWSARWQYASQSQEVLVRNYEHEPFRLLNCKSYTKFQPCNAANYICRGSWYYIFTLWSSCWVELFTKKHYLTGLYIHLRSKLQANKKYTLTRTNVLFCKQRHTTMYTQPGADPKGGLGGLQPPLISWFQCELL
jgi:hypothetical protein